MFILWVPKFTVYYTAVDYEWSRCQCHVKVGYTPLMTLGRGAFTILTLEAAVMLIDAGADVCLTSNEGESALSIALMNGDFTEYTLEYCLLLTDQGAHSSKN